MKRINKSNVYANPSFNEFIRSSDYSEEVKMKLTLNMDRVKSGSNAVLTTPLAGDVNPDDLLAEFDLIFDSQKTNINDVLLKLELDNRSKFGPRSISLPWLQRRESLTSSFETSYVDTKHLLRGPEQNRLRPISVANAANLLKNNTNSGLPYYTRKGEIKERVSDDFDSLIHRRDPCVLFTRTQEKGKTRNVWGYPVADTLNEMRYYSPLLDYQKKLQYRSALLAPEVVDRRLTNIIFKTVERRANILSIDFSAYDTTLKSQLQMVAFDYIKGLFQSGCSDELDYIAKRFNDIQIITPDGVYSGEHGVPSGSTFTNEVDSISQFIIASSYGIDPNDLQIQGDDGVYLVKGPSDADSLSEAFENVGLKVNGDKSYVSNNYAIYLQNLYHMDYIKGGIIGGIYPVYRALNRLIFQERWSTFEDYGLNGNDYYSIRSICILENCKNHPLFRELVKFILKRDKYSLGYSNQGLNNYVQMINKTEGVGDFLNHHYGNNVAGLNSFETVKLIKEIG
jgi:hypothetical protein